VGTKHPCLAQQQATTPVASRFRQLLEWAALTARWFRQGGLWFEKVKREPKANASIKIYPMHLLGYTQVFFETHLLHYIFLLSIHQHGIKIWSTHPDMISMKVCIHCNSYMSHPTWEFLPVHRQVDSWLWARWAEECEASTSRNCHVNPSKTF
jgi:hypothetical protein